MSINEPRQHPINLVGCATGDHYQIEKGRIDLSRHAVPVSAASIATDSLDIRIDRRKTALVIVDMQNDFCAPNGWLHSVGGDIERTRRPIQPIQQVAQAFRLNRMPVIWLNWGIRADRLNLPAVVQFPFKQMGGGTGLGDPQPERPGTPEVAGSRVLQKESWGAELVDELRPQPDDIRIDKHRISGFWDTPLDSILRNLGIRTLMFAGVNADQCVLATLMDATFHGYDGVLVADCVGTSSPDFCLEATLVNVRSVFGFVTDSRRVCNALHDA
ncbi:MULTISPECIES: isochorismatase family cysteine hydrolase [unclassified Caballeronia]|uniref:cysteine hydrolase family protein n=1 Tax=unclassified Caballeronia TaxID=2646786 RepID=UPI002028AC82|nr:MULTISPECIES: isochorismatase family cysteine hydrolase [unclassified Caballeronia]